MNFQFLSFLFAVISVTSGSKILLAFPLPSKSHYILGRALATGLVNSGHDITFISHFTDEPPKGNGTFRYINIPDCTAAFSKSKPAEFNYFDLEKINPFVNIPMTTMLGEICTRNAFDGENVKKLIQSKEKFDVVIMEHLFTEGLAALAWHFNASLVILSPVGSVPWINELIGNPSPASYSPNIFLQLSEHMDFWQRSENYLMSLLITLNQKFLNLPKQNSMVQKYFPNCPRLEEIIKNTALVLSNSHESTNPAIPAVPNVINIGGYHISPSTKKLPNDLQKLLDEAKDGVIYFSLGSHVKPSQMSQEVKRVLIKVLGSLKQTVLWKWDETDFPDGKPNNIVIGKWFPQQQILAHPNLKVFITHGGLLSLSETIHIGVPILSMPILGDQKLNALRSEALGIGKALLFSQLTEETFRSSLKELLTNPKYKETVKLRSLINRDRVIHPLDLAVYWIEYVIRYNGAPHLRVVGREQTWYQYYSIDVVLFWSLVILIPVYLIYKLIRKICCNSQKKEKIKIS